MNVNGNGKAARHSPMLDEARAALAAGISVVPPAEDGTKRPVGAWKQFQESPPTEDQLERWYGDRTGIGFVCGSVSAGLELFEFEKTETYRLFKAAAEAMGLGKLVARVEAGYCEETPGGGIHWLYRCDEVRPNTKLAERPDPTEANPHGRKVLIETRGEGGFVVVAPSFGRVHASGKPYRLLSGGVGSIATLTAEERDLLWALARSFDEVPAPEADIEPDRGAKARAEGQGIRAGDDYNARGSWDDLIGDWTRVFVSDGVAYLRRPGKDRGWSATLGRCKSRDGRPRLRVFTSSAGLPPGSYDLLGAYTALRHGGDLKAAVRALAEAGYGTWIDQDGAERPNPRPREAAGSGRPRAPTQAAADAAPEGMPTFANFETARIPAPADRKSEDKIVKVALSIDQIDGALAGVAEGWPKRVGDDCTLFVEGPNHRPLYLDNAARVFAWVGRRAQVDWTKGARFVPQERYYEHLRMTVEHFDAIETMPHWPTMPGIYYMHPPIGRGDGRHLNRLLDHFRPSSPEDRVLIRSFVLTLFWGGPLGGRPAFLITGPDGDEHQGRGIGKSKLADTVAELAGGYIDVAPTDQIADVKTRLLSDSARQVRLARLDNVKMLKFSWADLEGMITASEISGRMLYRGEGRRPNTVVWAITLNGASLSKDLAVRVIPIKLARPVYVAGWEDEVRSFIQEHRGAILADVRALLEAEPEALEPRTRWATWEREVLARCGMVGPCQAVIAERQDGADDDAEEQAVLADYIRRQIELRCNADPDRSIVFIPTRVAARFVNLASNQKLPTNKASAYLGTLGIAELRKSAHNGTRGWEWRGPNAPQGAFRMVLGDSDASDGASDGW